MNAPKCRACGGQLEIIDVTDKVCSRRPERRGQSCFNRLCAWAAKHRPEVGEASLESPHWAITVDEWLAAGAP